MDDVTDDYYFMIEYEGMRAMARELRSVVDPRSDATPVLIHMLELIEDRLEKEER